MKRLFLYWIPFLMCAAIMGVSCQKAGPAEFPNAVTYYPLETTTPCEDLSPYVESVELIPILDGQGQTLPYIGKIIVHDSTMFVLSGSMLFSFEPTGKQIRPYGAFGRGPGEYTNAVDFCLSRDNEKVACLVFPHAVMQFDIASHDFVNKIELQGDFINPSALIPAADNGYYVYFANPAQYDKASLDTPFYCLKHYDNRGRLIEESMLRNDFHISGLIKPAFCYGSYYTLSPGTIYSPSLIFHEGTAVEAMSFDFKDKNLPFRYAYRSDGNPWDAITDIFEQDYYKHLSSLVKTEDYLFFSAYGANSHFWNFYIGKNTRIRWQSFPILTSPMKAVGGDGKSLYFYYEDYGQIPVQEEKDPLKKLVLERFGLPDDPEVSYLLKVQFKV